MVRIPSSVAYTIAAVAASSMLAGCSAAASRVAPLSDPGASTQRVSQLLANTRSITVVPHGPTQYSRRVTKSWMKHVDARTRLAYMSDLDGNNVTVYDRNAVVVGQIGGFTGPQAIFVDSKRNLWVANSGAADVEVFARGATSPSKILNDPGQFPVDVTVCPNGTVYVSNLYSTSGFGSVSVYARGSTNPTGSLAFPDELSNFFITCDAKGNVFTDLTNDSDEPIVIEYSGGGGSGIQLPISGIAFPGAIKPDNAGNLLVGDQIALTITEYTESGVPTGNSISTSPSDIVDFAFLR